MLELPTEAELAIEAACLQSTDGGLTVLTEQRIKPTIAVAANLLSNDAAPNAASPKNATRAMST